MGRQIVKQPDGKFSIWSSITDDFIITDCTKKEYIEFRIKEDSANIKIELNKIFDVIDSGGKAYHQFTKTYEECLEDIKEKEIKE